MVSRKTSTSLLMLTDIHDVRGALDGCEGEQLGKQSGISYRLKFVAFHTPPIDSRVPDEWSTIDPKHFPAE